MKKIVNNLQVSRLLNIKFVLFLFVIASLVYLELPGMYLDAVNPDYMGLHIFHSQNVPVWAYSDNVIATWIEGRKEYSHFPMLNSLYGTSFEMYTMLLWSIPFGYGVVAIRTAHILYTFIMLVGVYFFLKYILEDKKKASFGTLILMLEPSLIFSIRTQYYIQLYPHMFFFFGIGFIIKSIIKEDLRWISFIGFALLGLSACSYFVFAFYFVAVLIVYITVHAIKKNNVLKKGFKAIGGFLVGYIPYLYAHISIMLTQGVTGWISALKGLDTYGLSDGASASIMDRIKHFIECLFNINGGASIINTMTSLNTGHSYGKVFAIFYLISVVVGIVLIIKKRNEIGNSRILIAILVLINAFIWHIILALIVGNALRYQHFIMLMPIMYMTLFLVGIELTRSLEEKSKGIGLHKLKMFLSGLVGITILVSTYKIVEGYTLIVETKGYSYYSKTIDDIAYYIDGIVTDNDVVISPQWGYWMQIACITNGKRQIWVDTDKETLQWRMDTTEKDGKYYVIVDNNTDREMISDLMDSKECVMEYQLKFNDYANALSPEIWVYAVK